MTRPATTNDMHLCCLNANVTVMSRSHGSQADIVSVATEQTVNSCNHLRST